MDKITEKNYRWAVKKLKPLKMNTVSGKEIEIQVGKKSDIARILEVSRQAIYDYELTMKK